MSLDNTLRSGLVREGEAIRVDVGRAVLAIEGRVRAHRRRRALQGLAASLVIALVVWAPPDLVAERADERSRPARDRFPEERGVERTESLESRAVSRAPAAAEGEDDRTSALEDRRRPRKGRAEASGSSGDVGSTAPGTKTTVGALPRQMVERYEVSYVAGTHVGENAGTGCDRGESKTGSNDCIPIQVHEGENEISLRIADDEGLVVGATVYQHAGGDATELVSFCGSTNGFVAVEPGALLLVYLDTSDRCSESAPGTGTLTAHFR